MDKIYISKQSLFKAVAAIVIIIGVIGWNHTQKEAEDSLWSETSDGEMDESAADSSAAAGELADESSEAAMLGVHVTGAVNQPDQVYFLKEGARVSDAIEAAGGAQEGADLSQLNLADYVKDGQRIYVPVEGEKGEVLENSGEENEETLLTNINLATKIELLGLPGIGEAYAQRILDYREANGPFESIEDIMKVKGIGESKFAELKDRITVG